MAQASGQPAKAAMFLAMHDADRPLVLLNVWDAASARIFEATGARAISTTSMGIAASAGLGEGGCMGWPRALSAIAAIAAAVDVPVTADVEKGYGETPAQLRRTASDILDAGVVGINIEDSVGEPGSRLVEPGVLAHRIRVIRQAASDRGVHLVINAKIDVFLCQTIADDDRLPLTLDRARVYRDAGADCIFVPGGFDRETIRALVEGIPAPLNVVANPSIGSSVPEIAELRELGVARVSVGSGLMRATLAFAQRAAEEILTRGVYDTFADELRRDTDGRSYRMAVRRE